MKSIHRWLLVWLLVGFAAHAEASDASEEQKERDEKAEAVEQKPVEPGMRPSGVKPTPDIFVPTEEISEDYAVSFPVDI